MADPVIALENVSLTLTSRAGPVAILKSVHLEIQPGESVAIVGPSGSGKTSLLMIVAGLERATTGSVRVAGHDFTGLGEDQLALLRGANIGIVFQSFHLVPTMTALENVALPLEFAGKPDAFEVARALLAEVGLAHRADHFPAQLSGGEQQRVALARALSPRPQILLADEPTGNLDGKTGEQVIDLLFGLQRRRAPATLILITHDLNLAVAAAAWCAWPTAASSSAGWRPWTVALSRSRPAPSFYRHLPLSLALALREQRNGLKGFYVFIACVALGVAVITGVGALADALRSSFERQGEALLGGDVTLSRPHKPVEGAERAWLLAQGRFSEAATSRAMARRLDGSEQALVELKGVDAAYPLVGTVVLAGGVPLQDAIRQGGAAIDPVLLERLGLKIGDKVSLGNSQVPVVATIAAEPDKLTERLTVGPRVLVSLETLQRAGLIDPGSLVGWRYAIKLANDAGGSEGGLASFRERAKTALPEAGFTVRDRRDPSPQVSRTLERLRQFLTLVGLTALLVGGVGVANAVATYIDRRRKVIAAFKSLGATSRVIFEVHLLQVAMIAAIGIVIGLVLGMAIPVALTTFLGDSLPIKADIALSWRSVATAAAYGLLVSLLFALWPLGRAEQVRAGVLFRDEVAPERVLPRPRIIAATIVVALLLVALAVFSSEAKLLALYYCIGVVAVFGVFLGLGSAIVWGAKRIKRPRQPELALAIGNLGAPGGLTRSVVLSLGAGLSLLVTVALVDRSIVTELTSRLPEESPNYFVLDIKRAEADAFRALVAREYPSAKVQEAPMLRGRLVKLGETPAELVKAPPEVQWVLNGDRGLTYSDGTGGFHGRCRHMVAGGLCRRTAGFVRGRHRQGPAPQDRRQRHGQCARPQRVGAHRQPAGGEVGKPVAEFCHGLFPQYARRRPPQPAGDRHVAEGCSARVGGAPRPADRP